jgi:hypothetical protein
MLMIRFRLLQRDAIGFPRLVQIGGTLKEAGENAAGNMPGYRGRSISPEGSTNVC